VNVAKSKWSVHFSTVASDYQLADGSTEATSHSVSETQVNFATRLEKPGDHHTFTLKVVNDGTFAAALKSIDLSALTEAEQKYLTYTLTYGDDAYTVSTSGLNVALPVGNSTPVMIDVTYIQPTNPADLPAE
jgi:hypothetical protein